MDDNYRPSRNDRDHSNDARDPRRSRSRSPSRRDHRDHTIDPRDRRDGSRDRYRDRRERSDGPTNGSYNDNYDRGSRPPPRSHDDRVAAKEQMMSNVRDSSQQDRRVYVGNLAYDVKWHHLKDHMRKDNTLEVLYADVLLLPNGMSKGCGIVEYATRDQAQIAINTLSNTTLMGRLVYVREDRETEPRFTGGAPPRGGGFAGGYGGGRGGYGGGAGGFGGAPGGGARHVFVSNLPYTVGWQDLKDLFRQAGSVVRADVHISPDGHPKGSGVVAFENPDDALNAISQFNGYDWNGRTLEVREDRYAAGGPGGFGGRGGGFGGGFGGRGGFQGGYGGGGFGGRGGFAGGRGGYGGGFGGGRGGYGGGFAGAGAGAGGFGAGAGGAPTVAPNPFTDGVGSGGAPGAVIHVKNLPWSTSNEDLVELFQTIGSVERAEIQYESNGRSRGSGVVQFNSQEDADTSIEKFQGYNYGGRPIGLDYARYPDATGAAGAVAAGASSAGEMEGQESTGNLQAQMM